MSTIRSLVKTLVLMGGLVAGGCAGDECDSAATKCEGNAAVTCTSSGERTPLEWHRTDCGPKHCVELSQSFSGYAPPICAIDPTPDPVCKTNASRGYCQADDTVVACAYGYRVDEIKCDPPVRCFDNGGDAKCQPPRPGLACFDAAILLGSDASNWVCDFRTPNGDACLMKNISDLPAT